MKRLFPYKKKALGLIEIIIALLLVVGAGIPILRMVFQSRTETSSSINYLRAMELADEAIEWANISNFKDLDKLKNLSGTITDYTGSEPDMIKINTSDTTKKKKKNADLFESNIAHSNQYSNAFFYRDIKVEPVSSKYNSFEKNLLKKVTVTIKWCEGYKPANVNIDSDRNREIQLSVLIINDDNLLY